MQSAIPRQTVDSRDFAALPALLCSFDLNAYRCGSVRIRMFLPSLPF